MAENESPRGRVGALILAAGLSTRMGRPKMLLPWRESTVIETVVNAYISAGVPDIVVVTGGTRYELEELLAGEPVRMVFNPLFQNGEMLDSLKIGLMSFLEGTCAVLVTPGDHPAVGSKEIEAVLDGYLATRSPLVVPSYRMRRGHPWMIAQSLWTNLLSLEPPRTLRDFLNENSSVIHYVNVDSASILMDMDTPEDYERLNKG